MGNVSQGTLEHRCLPTDLLRRPGLPYVQLLPPLGEVLSLERKTSAWPYVVDQKWPTGP